MSSIVNVFHKRARFLAIAWTLLIFFLCFLPGEDVPELDIPFIDKWMHMLLFTVFSFLWLVVWRSRSLRALTVILLASVVLGWLVEYIQGHLSFLHRSQDNIDTLADAVGGLLGVIMYYFVHPRLHRHAPTAE